MSNERHSRARAKGIEEAWDEAWFWLRLSFFFLLLGPFLWVGAIVFTFGAATNILAHEYRHGPGNTRSGDDPRFRLGALLNRASDSVRAVAKRLLAGG